MEQSSSCDRIAVRSSLHLDEQRRRLLVGTLAAFDLDTLERLGSTSGICVGAWCTPGPFKPAFTFVAPRSPLFTFTSVAQLTPCRGVLEKRDPQTGAVQQIADISPLITSPNAAILCRVSMAMTVVPATPRAFASHVQGRQVTLSWIDPGNATHFGVEAGSAPGLGDLLVRSVGATTLTVDDVPPGRYYVRVRAINEVGRSLPSADLVVVVP